MLTPQLRAQDRGAWRLRAMILAMNGRDKEATEIVNATMPPAMARNITPYLLRWRSEEHTSELQSLMRKSYAVFCLKKKNTQKTLRRLVNKEETEKTNTE